MRYLPWILLALAAAAAGLRAAWRRRTKKSAPLNAPGVTSNGHPPRAASPGIAPSNGDRRGTGPAGQLAARLTDPRARWILSVVADGALSGHRVSVHDLKTYASGPLSQHDLDRWSHQITVLCDQLAMTSPFRQLDIPSLGTVYEMEPGVAQQIKMALDGGSHRQPSRIVTSPAD